MLISQVKSPDNLVDFLEIPLPNSYISQQEIILQFCLGQPLDCLYYNWSVLNYVGHAWVEKHILS